MSLIGIIASSKLGAPTTPVAGYTLWLDAADTSTITASGGDVSQWNDKSGNASHFTQATGANQPKTGTRTINGKNVIEYDGTNDVLVCASSTSLFNYLHNSTGGTTFFVGLKDSGFGVQFMNQGGSSANTGVYSDNSDFTMITSNTTGNVARLDTVLSMPTGSTYMLTHKFSAGAATADRLKISLNSAAFVGTNTFSGAASGGNATNNMQVGGSNYDGVIAEVLFYSGILSSGDITLTQQYLTAKWGI